MTLEQLYKQVETIYKQYPDKRSDVVAVRLNSRYRPSVMEEIESCAVGIDWDMGKVVLQPKKPLTWYKQVTSSTVNMILKGSADFVFKHCLPETREKCYEMGFKDGFKGGLLYQDDKGDTVS